MDVNLRARFELLGWLLFIGSAGFFTYSSVRAGDPAAIIGSLLFLVACFIFVRPVISTLTIRNRSQS